MHKHIIFMYKSNGKKTNKPNGSVQNRKSVKYSIAKMPNFTVYYESIYHISGRVFPTSAELLNSPASSPKLGESLSHLFAVDIILKSFTSMQ